MRTNAERGVFPVYRRGSPRYSWLILTAYSVHFPNPQTDVLFVPAGGTCTISPGEVAELINLIAPRIVVPLHYRTEGVNIELEALDGLLGELGLTEVAPQVRLNVTSSNLPRELQVAVLQRVK